MPSLRPLQSRVAAFLERPVLSRASKEDTKIWRSIRRVDITLGCLIVFGRAFLELSSRYTRLWEIATHTLFGHWRNPYTLSEAVEDISFLANFWLIQLLWFTFCFDLPILRWFWKLAIPGTSGAMTGGGFLPRTSALTVGVVMFLTSAVLSETFVFPGKGQPYQGSQIPWPRKMTCLAIGTQLPDGVSRAYNPWAFQGCFYEGTPFYQRDWDARPNNTDAGHHATHPEDLCLYMCISWQNFGVDSIVKNLGVLTAGAVFVVSLTDSLSSRVGWSFVSEDSSPQELMALLRLSGLRSFGGSNFLCAVQLNALALLRMGLAGRFDSNGPQTASFIVTLVLLQSVLSVVLIRIWSPFHCKPIIYTQRLWLNGKDEFVLVDPETRNVTVEEIDLYEWIHLTNSMRSLHLMNYARRVTGHNLNERVTLQKETHGYIDAHTELDTTKGTVTLRTSKKVTVSRGYEGIVVAVRGQLVVVKFVLDDGTSAEIEVHRMHLLEHGTEWTKFDEWCLEKIQAIDDTA